MLQAGLAAEGDSCALHMCSCRVSRRIRNFAPTKLFSLGAFASIAPEVGAGQAYASVRELVKYCAIMAVVSYNLTAQKVDK